MNLRKSPLAGELFAQWQRARGERSEPATRPFSRSWDELLDAAGLASAEEEREAARDARELTAQGWLQIKPLQFRPGTIGRVSIPLDAEARWCAAFGFERPVIGPAEAVRMHEYPWEPELSFVRETRVSLSFEELRRWNDFLARGGRTRSMVPIKERSLELFGDEKRLDQLANSALVVSGRLKLETLRCEMVGEPLPWKRGPLAAAANPVIVLENAATWHSYDRWNQLRPQFSAVIYGGGNRFVDGVGFLSEIFRELGGGPRTIYYFGDLDPHGLRIPQLASDRAEKAGLLKVEPHLWSYRQLLAVGQGKEQLCEDELNDTAVCDWLGELVEPVKRLLAARQRLPQEFVGWEVLERAGMEL